MTAATAFVCATCGTLFPAAGEPPAVCPICEDVRQYVPDGGQRWTSMAELGSRHANRIDRIEPDLYALRSEPRIGIGQRALLVRTPEGNVLWDCLTLCDRPTIEAVRSLGGVRAIAISHPHYYSAHRSWAEAFDAPVYLHGADRDWVVDPHPRLRSWEGDELPLPGGLRLVRAGGHFPGGTVLLWPDGAGGSGALLSGDILQVVPDRATVGFMYSYPNYLPLPAWEVDAVADAVLRLPFDRIHGAFEGGSIGQGAREAVQRGRRRYREALAGALPGLRPGPGGRPPAEDEGPAAS
ncbi:MAG TPA: MBL fold metallo-hydrolase [Trueperaceae bacterium]|nr:MBL fold metallo-hydrolase [Trueperaceae bacterium]